MFGADARSHYSSTSVEMKLSRSARRMSCLISLKPTWMFTLLLSILISCTNADGDVPFIPSQSGNLIDSKCDPPRIVAGKMVIEGCVGYHIIPTDLDKEVKQLDMSKGNTIQVLRDGALRDANLELLSNLILQNCQIYQIENGAFEGGSVLQDLDLSKNKIEVLDPRVFGHLVNLRHLILKENPINRFQMDAFFPPIRSLVTLDISQCELDQVPNDAFRNLENLQKLLLDKNKLETLDWKVIQHNRGLYALTLMNNPWRCDCRVKFLIDTLREMHLAVTIQQTSCATFPTSYPITTRRSIAGFKWDSIEDQLSCSPHIDTLSYYNYDTLPPKTKSIDNDYYYDQSDERGQVKLGQDVYFECDFTGYPQPEIKWLKDNKPIIINPQISDESSRAVPTDLSETDDRIDNNGTAKEINLHESSTPIPLKPKMELQHGTARMTINMNEEEKKKNYKFKEHLILRRVEEKDAGKYECLIENLAGIASNGTWLNLTSAGGDDWIGAGHGNGQKRMAVWMWILVGLLLALILVLVTLLICLIWRKKERKKQEGFRKVIQEKFKESNIDLGELIDMKTTNPNQQIKAANNSEGATPLLDNRSEQSTILITDSHQKAHLPDVAIGNSDLIRNSQIFSPKPPPALHGLTPTEARKEFFARQISEPYFRPGSAMSLQRGAAMNAEQKRYIYANMQHYPTAPVPGMADHEHQYAIPDNIRMLPRSGSAMSMSALPDSDFRRQLFLRQNSQPQPPYATAMRYYPQRRNPSISSEPPNDIQAFNYSTLPRRPIRLQSWSRPVSPTGSVASNYSTLSWRPAPGANISDGIGPRRDAGGGSGWSLSKTPELTGGSVVGVNGGGLESMNRAMNTPSTGGGGKVKSAVRNPRMGHNRTPSSLTRGYNDFFSFEPIQEAESSECASNLNLEKPTENGEPIYSTQSLARGEPKYKKKKPPPIAFNPANFKEPSKAFDHLKGRAVSPSLRNGSINNANSQEPMNDLNGGVSTNPNSIPIMIQPPIMESPIDEVITPTAEESVQNSKNNRLSKSVPPPPPPKPKRNPTQEEEECKTDDVETITSKGVDSDNPVISDGTVV